MRKLKIVALSISCFCLASCVSTSVSSYTDPAYVGETFSSVAIFVDTADLEWRQDLETSMRDRVVAKSGANAARMMDIVPPTRTSDVSEMFRLLSQKGGEALIVVAFTDTGVAQAVGGNQYGVYTSESPWAHSDVTMYDVNTGAVIWTGTAKTQGDDMTDWSMVRRSAGNKIVEDLIQSGLLPLPEQDQ